jgi:hypothetical protein
MTGALVFNFSIAPLGIPSSTGCNLFTGFSLIILPKVFASNFNPNFLAAYNNPPVRSPASLKLARLESKSSSLLIVTSLPANGPLSYLNCLGPLSVLVAGFQTF